MIANTMTLKDAIDVIFSHNEIIEIFVKEDENHSKSIWRGMAHQLPEKYFYITDWRIFGLVRDVISETDTINIKLY